MAFVRESICGLRTKVSLSRIKNISADMQIFVDEFVTRVAETYGQR